MPKKIYFLSAVMFLLTAYSLQAAETGSISGTVKDYLGNPIEARISGAMPTAEDFEGDISAFSGTDGTYLITGVPVGTWSLRCTFGGTSKPADLAIQFAEGVTVSSGLTTTVNFTLPVGGRLAGSVTNTDGDPIPNATIWVRDGVEDRYWFCTNTDSVGHYDFFDNFGNLPPGAEIYEIDVGPPSGSSYIGCEVTGISVTASQTTTVNITLSRGASISGVVKNSSGVGQANVQVNCWADDGYGTGTQTEANGFYKCNGLPFGYNYNVVAYPPPDSNYMITRITVYVDQPVEYTGKDIELSNGGLKISGKVTDKATTLPLADVKVNYWCEDFEIGTDARTDVNGIYALTNLPPGNVEIRAEPESYYACIGIEFELTGDINNLNFALPAGAILCGRVLDAKTAEPLAGVEIDYEAQYADRNTFTDADGTFCLTQLSPGIGEVKAKPDVDSGYAWNLPWESDIVCLGEGENRSGRIIALEKGALVRGYIKDANGNASGIEYDYSGKKCDGWDDADDVNGDYQIRLPVGIYVITPDNTDEFGALPVIVTITDVNKDVNVPDMRVYTEGNGGQISGEVKNPGGYTKTGYFLIIAFKAGTALSDPNLWYTVRPIVEDEMENAGPFSLAKLPPNANYDIYLCVESETPDGIMSLAVRDLALNVAVGTTGINLEYSSQGSTVRGSVKNTDNATILGATVLLSDSSSSFGGFSDTDCNGQYVIYNVPAGTYTVTAVHSKYLNASTTVNVVDGTPADVNTIIMPFAGEKEGADLNGDGNVDMADVAEFAQQWLDSGGCEADFNQDNMVNFRDWARMAENWLSKAIWY
jgi:hypothetical protein